MLFIIHTNSQKESRPSVSMLLWKHRSMYKLYRRWGKGKSRPGGNVVHAVSRGKFQLRREKTHGTATVRDSLEDLGMPSISAGCLLPVCPEEIKGSAAVVLIPFFRIQQHAMRLSYICTAPVDHLVRLLLNCKMFCKTPPSI